MFKSQIGKFLFTLTKNNIHSQKMRAEHCSLLASINNNSKQFLIQFVKSEIKNMKVFFFSVKFQYIQVLVPNFLSVLVFSYGEIVTF